MAVTSGKKEPVVVDQETNEKYEEITGNSKKRRH